MRTKLLALWSLMTSHTFMVLTEYNFHASYPQKDNASLIRKLTDIIQDGLKSKTTT